MRDRRCATCAHRKAYPLRIQPPTCKLQRAEVRSGDGCPQWARQPEQAG